MKNIFKRYKKYYTRENPLYKVVSPRYIHNVTTERHKDIESFTTSEIELLSKILNTKISIPDNNDKHLYITKKGSYLTLFKMPDEWFLAESLEFNHDYKCDSMEGVIQLIKDFKLDKL